LKKAEPLDELVGHKSGVLCMNFIDGRLYSGSFDHYVLVWNLQDVEAKINEQQIMKAEDLRSKKF
jgi:hypothetical protein